MFGLEPGPRDAPGLQRQPVAFRHIAAQQWTMGWRASDLLTGSRLAVFCSTSQYLNNRITMRRIRKTLRLYAQGRPTCNDFGPALTISHSAVGKYVSLTRIADPGCGRKVDSCPDLGRRGQAISHRFLNCIYFPATRVSTTAWRDFGIPSSGRQPQAEAGGPFATEVMRSCWARRSTL